MKPEFGAQSRVRRQTRRPGKIQGSRRQDEQGHHALRHGGDLHGADVIDPRDTRDWLIRMLEIHRMRLTGGVGEHLMRTWPTSY